MESCKLRYFNSFEFFDHTGLKGTSSKRFNTSGCGAQRFRNEQRVVREIGGLGQGNAFLGKEAESEEIRTAI